MSVGTCWNGGSPVETLLPRAEKESSLLNSRALTDLSVFTEPLRRGHRQAGSLQCSVLGGALSPQVGTQPKGGWHSIWS